MSQDRFVVTPSNYTKQLEVDYRNQGETVSFDELEEARERCTAWLTDNKDNFSSSTAKAAMPSTANI